MYLTELSSGNASDGIGFSNSKSLPKHFKISSHQSNHYYDCNKDTLYVTKSIVVVMQLPYVTASYKFLNALVK